jgi:hypothetical protein
MIKIHSSYLDMENARCDDSNTEVNRNRCFEQYLERYLGCALPWQKIIKGVPECSNITHGYEPAFIEQARFLNDF